MQQPEPEQSEQPELQPVAPVADQPELTVVPRPQYRWYDKVGAVMAAIFCFELGLFLLVYPWVTEWEPGPGFFPVWARELWDNPWFRGALSGLGVINIWISFVEVFRFRRFSS